MNGTLLNAGSRLESPRALLAPCARPSSASRWPRPRRLVGGDAGAAGHAPPVRRRRSPTVAWVLISYNLVLAAAAVPAAHAGAAAARRLVCAAGLVVFSAASLACGLAPSFARAPRRPLRAGGRRRRWSSRRRSSCSRRCRGLGGARRSRVGARRRPRRRARTGGRRRAHPARRLGVDLPRAGARSRSRRSPPLAPRGSARAPRPGGRPPACAREPRAAVRLGCAERRAVPARDPARQRLGLDPGRCRASSSP